MKWKVVLSVLIISIAQALAQSSLALVGSSSGIAVPVDFPVAPNYVAVNRITFAPGQVLTLQVTGIRTLLPEGQIVRATTIPLPTNLYGISVTIDQEDGGTVIEPVPLLALSQVNYSPSTGANSCVNCLTYITVQVPFELSGAATLIGISENGTDNGPFDANPTSDNIHVITTCDTAATFVNCHAVVTHADGTVISSSSPALPNEEIVIYAFGLGKTTPMVKTGQASPTPAAFVSSGVNIQFDFRPNAGPSRPYTGVALPAPLFVGLTPGQVGLYQINVRLPDRFPSVPPCDGTAPPSGGSTNVVQSNLTIDIGGVNSFDGAAICVQPGQSGGGSTNGVQFPALNVGW